MLASYKAGITEKFYPTHADLLKDLAEIARDEVEWLVSEGVNYIQFDAPYYSHYLDPRQRQQMKQAGLDPIRNSRTRLRETTPRWKAFRAEA